MQKRSQENERIINDSAFTAANADLQRHLKVIRGRHPGTFRYLASRPIRVASPAKLAKYEKSYVELYRVIRRWQALCPETIHTERRKQCIAAPVQDLVGNEAGDDRCERNA